MEESEPTPIVIDVQVQDSATNQDIKREDDPNVVSNARTLAITSLLFFLLTAAEIVAALVSSGNYPYSIYRFL